MNCLSCTADVSNGLALCETCRTAATVYLEFVPVYFRNLARWRPGRAGARPVPGSREPQTISSGSSRYDRVSDALDEAGNALSTWARMLHDDRGVELPEQDEEHVTVTALCQLFNDHLTSIATLDWAGEFVKGMAEHEHALRVLTERVVPGWYAGECLRCSAPTYVVPGLTWVTCGTCGVTTYARDHLETILREARGWVARPMRMAEAIVALVDTELSVPRLYERIKKWEQRGRVTGERKLDSDGDPVGAKRYRMGDVLDLLAGEGSTRLDASRASDSAVAS